LCPNDRFHDFHCCSPNALISFLAFIFVVVGLILPSVCLFVGLLLFSFQFRLLFFPLFSAVFWLFCRG
jgi:hypothetical protein